MTIQRETRGMIEVCAAFALAGSSIVAGKLLAEEIPPFTTGFFSILFALSLLVPLQFRRMKEIRNLSVHEWVLMFFQALTGIFLNRFLTLYGLRFTGAVSAGLITSSTPAVMALLSFLFLGERPGRWTIRGVFLVLAGLCLFSFGEGPVGGNFSSLRGNLLIFASVLAEVAMSLLRKKSEARITSLTNATVLFLISLLLFFPFALREWQSWSPSQISWRQWMVIAYYGYFASAVAYILWGAGVLKVPGIKTGIAFAMIPLTSILLSLPVLGETLSFHQVSAMIFCAGGMLLSCRLESISKTA